MQRRDFLHPLHIIQATGAAMGAMDELTNLADEPAASRDPVPLLQLTRRAMATNFELLLPYGLPEAQDAGEAAFALIDQLESQMTIYRENSEVSRINRFACSGPVKIEEGLFRLFQLAQLIHQETQGAFDITSGPLVKAWGFFKGPPRIPSLKEREEALKLVGMNHIELDEKKLSVRMKRGMEINLGSIGKGYALDRAARLLFEQWGIPVALFQGGHSSVYALGCQPGEPRGWSVGLQNPEKPGERLGIVYLKNRGIGTSAATFKHLEIRGRKLGHILDPRTGWPADALVSATVLAPTATEADALATALFILGLEGAQQYCTERPEIGAILFAKGSSKPILLNVRSEEIELN